MGTKQPPGTGQTRTYLAITGCRRRGGKGKLRSRAGSDLTRPAARKIRMHTKSVEVSKVCEHPSNTDSLPAPLYKETAR